MASQESNVKQGKHAAVKEAPTETWEDPRVTEAKAMRDRARAATTYPEESNKPDLGIAYILLLMGGLFGLHRIYADPRAKSGFVMLILTVSLVGLVVTPFWWVVDLFLLPSFVRESTR